MRKPSREKLIERSGELAGRTLSAISRLRRTYVLERYFLQFSLRLVIFLVVLIAYLLRNTVTENGHVARGICQVKDGFLTDVVERTHIEKRGEDGAYTEDGVNFVPLSGDVPVSMNCWAFGHAMMDELEGEFPAWLDEALRTNPQKAEYFLPFVANDAIKAGRATVRVLPCREQWYGMTYKEDMQSVKDALARMRAEGVYPDILLD